MYQRINTDNYLEIMKQYNIDSLLAKVICSLNYSEHDLTSFFHPLQEFVLDQSVFEPIKQALLQIQKEKKKVFVFGDYDCDGICATTIIIKVLKALKIECGYYIPSRNNEGYGLNIERLKQAKAKGYEVLLTVDNGVSCQSQLEWAKENGMMTIVTDHHLISSTVNSDYFLHPSLLEEDYQYLCGTAVVYLIAIYLGLDNNEMKVLAMLATIADVMSLKGANIKIVLDGLEILNAHKYRNVEIMDNFEYPIDEMDISFKVIPKINAVGRMSEKEVSDANQVVKFFLSNNASEMNLIFNSVINTLNQERRNLSSQQYALCKKLCNDSEPINFIYLDNLHIGILGLIANRIADETNKITFIFTNKDDGIIGSVRSVNQIDIMEILNQFKNKTTSLGGHAFAAGMSLKKEYLNDLKQFVFEKCSHLNSETIHQYVDLDISELNKSSIAQLFQFHPFGQDRKLPLFKITIKNDSLKMMKLPTQLKWNVDGIDFVSFQNEGYNFYKDKEYVTIVGKLQINKYRGFIHYQMLVNEILNEI